MIVHPFPLQGAFDDEHSHVCDQQTMTHVLAADPLMHRLRTFFALFASHQFLSAWPTPHPLSASIKALLLTISEGLTTGTYLRRYLVEHLLVMLELDVRLPLDMEQPDVFDVTRTVPRALAARAATHPLAVPAASPAR